MSRRVSFDSPRRHHFLLDLKGITRARFSVYPSLQFRSFPSASNIGLQLFLTRSNPRCVVLLGDAHTLMPQQNRDTFNRHTGKKQFHGKRIAESMGVPVRNTGKNKESFQTFLPNTRSGFWR